VHPAQRRLATCFAPCLSAAALLFSPAGRAAAQQAPEACLTVPQEFQGYQLKDTRIFPDSANGIGFLLADSTGGRVTLFIYPIPPALRAMGDIRSAVREEGNKFQAVMQAGLRSGYYQALSPGTIAHPDSAASGGEYIPGFLGVAVARRGNTVAVEMQYLFAVCDRFVKLRTTLSSETWSSSPFPTFARDMAAYLARH
jgi:hypothetical protein